MDDRIVTNQANLPEDIFTGLKVILARHAGLNQVLAWAVLPDETRHFSPQIVTSVIAQDEYTNDVVIPYRDVFLVYDIT